MTPLLEEALARLEHAQTLATGDTCKVFCDDLVAIIERVKALTPQPIEKAPRDGRRLLANIANNGLMIIRWAESFSTEHYGDPSSGWYCETLDRRVNPRDFILLDALDAPPRPDGDSNG